MTRRILFSNPLLRLAGLLMLALLVTGTGLADDRDLVKETGEEPYLFVIFDVSGSMNWTPPDLANGLPQDRWAPGYGDDPNSKFYQAKSALFQVMQDPELGDIHWGFATYNQDNVRAYRKHYLYSPVQEPPWAADLPYPMPGMPKHFGDTCMDDTDSGSGCDLDSSHGEIYWDTVEAAYTLEDCSDPQLIQTNLEEIGETLSFPALGPYGNDKTVEWVGANGRTFQVIYHDLDAGAYGDDTITVEMSVKERDGCGSWGIAWNNVQVEFEKTYLTDNNGRDLPGGNEMLIWQIDDRQDGSGAPSGFWNPDDNLATNTCRGWEPNNDSSSDDAAGVNIKYPTVADPASRHAWALDRGDVIPWDWRDEAVWGAGNSNRAKILERLAPSYDFLDADTADFRVAPYFEDLPDSFHATNFQGRLALKPQYVNTPPLLPNGSTPIGNSMYNFMQWFDQWKPVASGPGGDEQFGCRTVNLLILSDGDETCYGGSTTGTTDSGGDYNPCWIADRLLNQNNRSIRTFIIGFGVPGADANFLNCIAQRGGTDAIDLDNDGVTDVTGPILPGNEQELVDALKTIANAVKSQSRSFASAAVPQAQVNVDDKVYLTSFMPLQGRSIWPGRLDAYLRPVPLREQDVVLPDGTIETRLVPDPTKGCSPGDESECHIWNAGEELLLQAAEDDQLIDVNGTGIGDGTFNLGAGEVRRRVYYSIDRTNFVIPDRRRYFRLNATNSDGLFRDMLYGMDICNRGDAACALDLTNRDEAFENMNFLHRIKTAEDPDSPGNFFDYILGDFFHSDPLVYGNPDNFAYWVGDVEGSGTLPLEDPCDISPDGYRCFFAKHRYRRKVIIAGTNDGQAHVFDAGFFRGPGGSATGSCETNPVTSDEFVVGEFDNGSGRELFSYVPRAVMPTLKNLRQLDAHEFTVDGRIARGDAFIDPVQETGVPVADEREWRSVLVGTLREGGSGIYALDITHPDELLTCDGLNQIPQARGGALDYVPSCIGGGVECGTARYPEVMWEFHDNKDCINEISDPFLNLNPLHPDNAVRCDDDNNGFADLAHSWSRPTIARIRVDSEPDGDVVDKYVAVFGGGMEREHKYVGDYSQVRGNFLFMVDIETGRAIYKRAVLGSAPADPAVVDTDQDGYADTVYFGTLAGLLYKVDISTVPLLEDLGSNGGLKITDSDWEPFAIFNTFGRPLYHEPTVVFVTDLGKYAVAFGTGDREDLWYDDPNRLRAEGRFYMFVDRDFEATDSFLPLDETDIQQIAVTDANTTADYLRQSPFGWYLELEPDERVISEAFSLAGVTIFSTYSPEETISDDGTICRFFGDSKVYVVTSTASNTLLSSNERFYTIEGGFLSPPFAETSQTKNPTSGDGGPTADDLPDDMVSVVSEIKKLLPTNCKYANYTINIKAVRDDTGIQFLAAIPICSVEANWKDF